MSQSWNHLLVISVLVVCMLCISTVSEEEEIYIKGYRLNYDVYIINGFTSEEKQSLFVRCQSKDDDLGRHYLRAGENFHWHFRINFLRTTLFFCHMKWGQKDTSFDVFKANSEGLTCERSGKVYWLVTETAFYLSDDNYTWWKKYNWP